LNPARILWLSGNVHERSYSCPPTHIDDLRSRNGRCGRFELVVLRISIGSEHSHSAALAGESVNFPANFLWNRSQHVHLRLYRSRHRVGVCCVVIRKVCFWWVANILMARPGIRVCSRGTWKTPANDFGCVGEAGRPVCRTSEFRPAIARDRAAWAVPGRIRHK
jgi:hypothetical protein